MRNARSAMVVVAAALATACAASQSSELEDDEGTGPSSSSSASGAGGGLLATVGAGGSTSSGGDECSEAAKLVYVVGTGNELYSFAPATLTFTPIGTIACPVQGFATPFSMAVDRQGIAWVLFNDGKLFRVNTVDASCQATSYVPSQLPGFTLFGMGFASNGAGSDQETLYLASFDGVGVAKLDTATLKVTSVGSYDQLGGPAELTGTGDGRLYGFFLSTPVVVAEIDKSNAHILSQAPQPSVNIGGGWAFAFWGGDFWLFTAPNGISSQVDRYSPGAGTTTVYPNVGFTIVGAGVSTCAPVEAPK